MNSILLKTRGIPSSVSIDTVFIDHYMIDAPGEYVKLYLYLLRCLQFHQEVTLHTLSERLELTEKEIFRGLNYWVKAKLLKLTYTKDQQLSTLDFLPFPSTSDSASPKAKSADTTATPSPAPPKAKTSSAPVKNFTPDKIRALKGQEEIRQLLFIAEQYLGKTLTTVEISNILYYYQDLHFSTDLIEYLIEYCVGKNCKSARYMEKVALAWYDAGITSVEEAKDQGSFYPKEYYAILHAFGIQGRNPAEAEISHMSHWLNDLHFSMDLILEACKRTILNTHQPNFPYTNKILEKWAQAKVHRLSDLNSLDESHMKKAQAATQTPATPTAGKGTKFNNFHQRDYDFAALEKELLNQ